ncbi:hypothetical protein BSKO_02046 [Bryopsis sp. KO-2023]|nr:hypothetical protein BSKO_02046 [Bryopsis sp. KO-2023]
MSEGCGPTSRKDKTVEERFRKMDHEEHILERPDSYVGSCQPHELELWIHDGENMVLKTFTIVPALYKIFDEILVNAADNKVNDPKMDELRVEVDQEACRISVWNNGNGIPVQIHQEHNIYVPQLIFSELLTSDNYDDTEEKVTGGRNGYGAKLTNIYSNKFTIETCDLKNNKKYKQTFTKNMTVKPPPTITENKKKESWTKVTFEPDLSRFGLTRLDDNMVSLIRKRTYDMAGVLGGKKMKVSFNGTRLKVKNFQDYVDMYLGPKGPEKPRVYERVNDRWEVCVAPGDGDKMQQVAFVNAICTSRGGKHVDHVVKQITEKLVEEVGKKTKTKGLIKPAHVRNHLRVFLNCQINNPAFDSQTKENLTSNVNTFGSKCEINEEFMKKVKKSGILEQLEDLVKIRGEQALKKTDGSKRSRLHIAKLEDAHQAGSKNSHHCTLILTEGDSAKAFAMAGLELVGRERYGVFPLRGKLMNVRDATNANVSKNAEIQNIKKILGLQHGKVYEDMKALRYGHVMIMTDQDYDGSHIKGLIINFFHKFYPSLLKNMGFLQSFVTPVVKATKKTGSKEVISFYTMPEYHAWRETVDDPSKFVIKYYKGLGSSTGKEAKENFAALDSNQKLFIHNGAGDDDAIDKAFSRIRTEERKEWLNQYQLGTYLDHNASQFTYSEFVDKELILFSRADVGRSIPSMLDGFKPAQRKILYCCFKRNLKWESDAIKVSQLAGYVSEHSMYHHGEMSLHQAIVNLAQDFCGSNNINLLYPEGQFGTRMKGGKDYASARYICTKLTKIARCIFHPDDDITLKYLEEDGIKIEPEWYIPILPMVLVNGAEGIGTGWSTSIPNYNPRDIVANIKRMLDGSEPERMTPWYKHFKGTLRMVEGSEQEVTVAGIINVDENNENLAEITELPIKKWTAPYAEFLEQLITPPTEKDEPILDDSKNFSTPASVHFEVQVIPEKMAQIRANESFYKTFNLKTRWKLSNFVLFDANGKVARYKNAEEILKEFFDVRQKYYNFRKNALLKAAKDLLVKLDNMIRFILAVVNDELVVSKRKRAEIEQELERENYAKIAAADGNPSYSYLLNMPIHSLTFEKVENLQSQVDEQKAKVAWWESVTVKTLWINDLDQFMEVLDEVETREKKEEEADMEEYRKRAKKGGRAKPKPRRKAVRATSETTEITMPPPSRGGGRGGRGGRRGRGSRANSTVSRDAPQQSGPSVKIESLREKLAKNKPADDVDMDEVTSPLPPSLACIAECMTAEKKSEQDAAKEPVKPKKPKRKANVLPSSSEEDSEDEGMQDAKVSRVDLTGEGADPVPEADVGEARLARPRRANNQPKPEATNLLSSDDDENAIDTSSDDEKDSDFAPSD